MKSELEKKINESLKAKYSLLLSENKIDKVIKLIYLKIKKNGKIFICGNGGSAADAQHLAAEFIVRLRPKINRRPLPALSIVGDTSTITACSNDYDFSHVFKRNLEALATKKDLLLAISTSGNSKNIVNVLKFAKKNSIKSIGFFGATGGKAKNFCDNNLLVKSNNVARIQEAHIFLGHYILEKVEDLLIQNRDV
jgi:D-sedoheptulose 7-phosphate isomerase